MACPPLVSGQGKWVRHGKTDQKKACSVLNYILKCRLTKTIALSWPGYKGVRGAPQIGLIVRGVNRN